MKIKYIISAFAITVIIFIMPTVLFTLSNNLFDKNFVFSHYINNFLGQAFPSNNYLLFKQGDFFYKLGMYDIALENYQKVNCQKPQICQELYHNEGNVFYRMGEKLLGLQKINLLKDSVSSYKKSLEYAYNSNTKKNYDFVLKKLNNEMDVIKKEQKKDQEKQDKGNKKEEKQANEEKKPSQENNNSSPKEKPDKSQPDEQKKSSSEGADVVVPKGNTIEISRDDLELLKNDMTPEEKEKMQKYIQSLQDEEKQNIEFNKPQNDRDIYDILGEDFGTKPGQQSDW